MALELTGKILQIMPETSGVSKAGKEWKKQEFLIETIETYPKKVFLSMMGDKTNEIRKFAIGSTITASLNIESREYQGKYYTDVRAWRIVAGEGTPPSTGSDPYKQDSAAAPQQAYAAPAPLPASGAADDDLPF